MTDDFEQQVAEHGARLAAERVEQPYVVSEEPSLFPDAAPIRTYSDGSQSYGPYGVAVVEERTEEQTQRCPNCAPGYDCERGIYVPADSAQQIEALRRQIGALRDVNESLASSVGAAHQAGDAVAAEVLAEVEALRRDMRLILGATIRDVLEPGLARIASAVQEERK